MKIRTVFVALLLACAAVSHVQAKEHRIGCWWWYAEDAYEEPICTQYLDELQKAGVTEIYFGDAFGLASGRYGQIHLFVEKAMARGMRVAILYAKWKDFMLEGGAFFGQRLVPNFQKYRKAYPKDDLYGFHLDIEKTPDVPSYCTEVLQEYCDRMVAKVQGAREAGILCEVDVPCGWNKKGGQEVVFRGTKGIYNILAKYMDAVTIMSYRDEAQQILAFADMAAFPAMVANRCDFMIGVETADSHEGGFVDFHDEDKPRLFKEMDAVFKVLDKRKLGVQYGMAIHHARSFVALPGEIPDGNGRNVPAAKGSVRGGKSRNPPRTVVRKPARPEPKKQKTKR